MEYHRVTFKNSEKIGFISSFATMLAAGIPILDVVNSLIEDAKGSQRKVLEVLREDLQQGRHVYVTFSKFPRVFDRVTVSIIKASEEAGTLDVTLKDLRTTIQKDIEFSDKVKSALAYPVFIGLVFLGVLLMILLVVVPKIATVFERLRVTLPAPTKILIALSNLLTHQTLWFLSAAAIITVSAIVLYKSKRSAFMEIFYSMPLISHLMKEIDITRFSRSLYLLLSSGMPITAALELATDVVRRQKTAQIIRISKDMVFGGKKLSEGFRSAKGYIPAIMIKLLEAGERTGTLEKSMQDIAEYFDYEVTNTLKVLTSLLEPVLLVVVGLVVGGMMLAIIAPIYGLIGQVGSR